jgi:tetratricopeptide (TPR) repeat protein
LVRPCRFCGLLEASRAAHENAFRLDPGILTSVGQTYWMMGQASRALTDTFGDIGYLKGVALLSLGRPQEAIDHLRSAESAAKSDRVRLCLRALRALAEGRREESVEAGARFVEGETDPEALYYIVRGFAYLGETDRALAGIRRAVQMGFFCYPLLLSDPWLDPIRTAGEFNAVLSDAETRHREAAVRFAQAGGNQVVGLRRPL